MTTELIKTKPKAIKIGHGYYDLKLIKELVASLPDGKVALASYPAKPKSGRYTYDSQPPKLVVTYPRGQFTLLAGNLSYYAYDGGKIKGGRCTYSQGDDINSRWFSILPVDLAQRIKLEVSYNEIQR